MNTLHIIPNINARMGGSVRAVLNILKIEKSIGAKSTVISAKADAYDPDIEELSTLIKCKPSFPVRFLRSKSANNWLRANCHNYDLAIIHTIWGVLQVEAANLLHQNRVPFVIWPHGSLDPFDLQKKKYLKKILGPILIAQMLSKSKKIICTSKLELERLEQYGGSNNCEVLPLPVDSGFATGDRERFRNKYSFGDKDFVFLFLSLIYYKKGLDILIPAIKKISMSHPNIKLVIAGSDLNGYEKKVRSWLHQNNLEDRIVMTGFLSGQDKYDAFAGGDCFVLPSRNENFGVAIVEALGCGLPVLISNNVYIWKEIVQCGGGWVCNYSIESLSKMILKIMEFPSILKIKQENAKRAAEYFSPENLNPLYKRFYHQVI